MTFTEIMDFFFFVPLRKRGIQGDLFECITQVLKSSGLPSVDGPPPCLPAGRLFKMRTCSFVIFRVNWKFYFLLTEYNNKKTCPKPDRCCI